ncbi:EAL domain-containing protein [Catenovulum sp. SM1970]|uniref:putative bifunctional diguanylate cyclase/phosphodiesterase n=1 Tax=Marinifaba aquimaris TaxID=2741323 RepID=UPI001573863C|nr:GGDEF domain-containing phosphodiesterase [Marinifaba aquimaris]NTS77219.1 EAL domain-containing protein [Marinifaba aquimaris]
MLSISKLIYRLSLLLLTIFLASSQLSAAELQWRTNPTETWQPLQSQQFHLSHEQPIELKVSLERARYFLIDSNKVHIQDLSEQVALPLATNSGQVYQLIAQQTYHLKLTSLVPTEVSIQILTTEQLIAYQGQRTWLWAVMCSIVVVLALYAVISGRLWQRQNHYLFLAVALALLAFLGYESGYWAKLLNIPMSENSASGFSLFGLLLAAAYLALHRTLLVGQTFEPWLDKILTYSLALPLLAALACLFLPANVAYQMMLWLMLTCLFIGLASSLLTAPKSISDVSFHGYTASWAIVLLVWLVFIAESLLAVFLIDDYWLSCAFVMHAFVMLLMLAEWRMGQVKKTIAKYTAQHNKQQQSVYAATHDQLTGLPSQLALANYFDTLISRDDHQALNLVVFKVKDFQHINQSLGFITGDTVLVQIAKRLNLFLAERSDVVCIEALEYDNQALVSLGGVRFAFLAKAEKNSPLLKSLNKKINAILPEPIVIESQVFDFDGCFGCAEYPKQGIQFEDLLHKANTALEHAALNHLVVAQYQDELELITASQRELVINLKQAIEAGQLKLFIQPIFDINTKAIIAAEALIRWRHPERGLIKPAEFIELAEKSQVIYTLTRWVMAQAVKRVATWLSQGIKIKISVNLSSKDLLQPEIVDYISQQLATNQVAPELLNLEIKEAALLEAPDKAYQTIIQLNELGVTVVIDDFGQGLSSLAYIRKLPIAGLKIDAQTVASLFQGDRSRTIVAVIIDIGRNLELDVIAEGVEDNDVQHKLMEMGVTQAQGFLYSKPFEIEGFIAWYKRWSSGSLS